MTTLKRFDITPRDGGFLLQLEDETGKVISLTLTPEQLDSLIDAADELLDEDDAAFEVEDDGQTYQKPLG